MSKAAAERILRILLYVSLKKVQYLAIKGFHGSETRDSLLAFSPWKSKWWSLLEGGRGRGVGGWLDVALRCHYCWSCCSHFGVGLHRLVFPDCFAVCLCPRFCNGAIVRDNKKKYFNTFARRRIRQEKQLMQTTLTAVGPRQV